ncbi:hypothetical protein D3C80_1857840 [compost metagenome]
MAEQQREQTRIVIAQQPWIAAIACLKTAPQVLGQGLERPMGSQRQQLRATLQVMHQPLEPLPLQRLRQVNAHQQRRQFFGPGFRQPGEQRVPGQ